MKHLISILIICFFYLNAYTQNPPPQSVDFNPPQVVRHNAKTSLPDTIHIIGYIVSKPARGYCGHICMGGTIKVKLKKAIPNYNNEFVYLVTACLGSKAMKGSGVDVIASKLKFKESACYYNNIMNGFDSKGFPFYKLSEKETDKIN